jgi:3-methyladenine DNA glycosylase AlkC
MTEKFSLKDHLFNHERVAYLASLLAAADKNFDATGFEREVMSTLLTLELKDRIRWIADVLTRHLPTDYENAVAVIVHSLPPPLDPQKTDDDFGEFILAPFGEYVAQEGCTRERLVLSLETLRELTMRFSMEDAIRYYLRAFPKETLRMMKRWVRDDNYHVRRLVSEGTRPLLPWSGRVPLTTADTLPLLTALHADQTRYVTRSIANHLNDLAKQDPDLVIKILKKWQREGGQDEKELAWMTKHALRTLIKNGHGGALALLGYTDTAFTVDSFDVLPETVRGGEVIALEATLTATADTNLLIDYIIHFVKKNGSTAPKVFKWKLLALKAGESITLKKNHRLKADATTFTLYTGVHRVSVQVNGIVCAERSFLIL